MRSIDREVIAQIRSNVTFEMVFQAYNNVSDFEITVPKNTGSNYKILCPFHSENTPSLDINVKKGLYHCFGCHSGGDIYDLTERLGLADNFPDAVRFVGKLSPDTKDLVGSPRRAARPSLEIDVKNPEYNLDTPDLELMGLALGSAQWYFRKQLEENSSSRAQGARDYLQSRGISEEFAEKVGIGYAPAHDLLLDKLLEGIGMHHKNEAESYDMLRRVGLVSYSNRRVFSNRITFPIATRSKSILGFNARKIDDQNKRSTKYKNSPRGELFSKGHILYGLDQLKTDDVRSFGLVLVEGQTDTYGFIKQRLNCALTLGSTALTEHHVGIIRLLNPKTVYIMADGDSPGIQGAIKNANRLLGTSDFGILETRIVPLPSKEDDPFDLFFTQEVPVREYIEEESLSPKEFLTSQDEHDLMSNGQTGKPFSFLEDNTTHIVTIEELVASGFSRIRSQRDSSFSFSNPHPFLLRDYIEIPIRN